MNSQKIDVGHYVPALPGYFLLYLEEAESGRPESLRYEPVIAWSIEGNRHKPYPITCDGVDAHEAPLRRPDGTVADLAKRWPSANTWLISMQSEWDKQEEQEREAAQKRYESFIKDNGISVHDQVAEHVVSPSPARTAINAALAAAKAATGKGGA